jgi:RimJ/RimL family protein N-acetyltransferase
VPTSIQLRPVLADDIALFFEHHLEVRPLPVGASITERKATFTEGWEQMLADETVLARTIVSGRDVAGYVICSRQREKPTISSWLGRKFWGHGIATKAVKSFVDLVEERPVYARVAYDNLAALQVLRKIGFAIIGHDSFFSDAHGYEIDEIICALS